MTLDQMVIRLWDILGRPTDLQPLTNFNDETTIDSTTTGYIKLQAWLEDGFNRVLSWKPANRGVYQSFHRPIKRSIFSISSVDITSTFWSAITLSSDRATFTLVTPVTETSSFMKSFKVTAGEGAGSTYRAYYSSDGTELIVIGDSLSFDATTEATLCPRVISLSNILPNDYTRVAIRALSDITNLTKLERVAKADTLIETYDTIREPKEFDVENHYIYLDSAIEGTIFFELEYYYTSVQSMSSELILLPERYHPLIVQWAAYLSKLRYGENDEAYSFRGLFEQDIKTIMDDFEHGNDRLEGGFEA